MISYTRERIKIHDMFQIDFDGDEGCSYNRNSCHVLPQYTNKWVYKQGFPFHMLQEQEDQ